jgi:hypothetical protein
MRINTLNLTLLSVSLIIIWILPLQLVNAAGSILNPDFEGDSGWTFYDNGEYWTGEYSTAWASQGSRSYMIHIPPSGGGCGNFPGGHTYGEFSQDVDLTGVGRIIFDLNTFGIWYNPQWTDSMHSAEVWIGNTQVYYREKEIGTFLDQSFSTFGYSGINKLTFRMQGHSQFCYTNDRGLYIDNIRMVDPVASFLPMVIN